MTTSVTDIESKHATAGVTVLLPAGPQAAPTIENAEAATRISPAIYLVATDNGHDPAYTTSRAAGLELARTTGARVVLYDRSSESYWTDPYGPGGPGGSVPGPGQLLGPEALRRHGYSYLADQLEQARALGLDADATLAWGAGPTAMVRCCEQVGVTHVILPAALARPSLLDRLMRRTLTDFQAKLDKVMVLTSGDRGLIAVT